MKKFMYFAVALLVLVGCNKNSQENKENAPENYGTISGKIELPVGPNKIAAPDGWATATEAFTMQWEATDEIYIYNTQDCKLLKNPSITDNIATFEGDLLPDMTEYKVAYGYNPKATGVTEFTVPYVKDNYRPFADGTGKAFEFTIANFGPVIGLQLKGTDALTKIEVVLLDNNKQTLATYTMPFGDKPLALDATTATKVYFPIQYKEDATRMCIHFYKKEDSKDVLIMSKTVTGDGKMPAAGVVAIYPELTVDPYNGHAYVDLGLSVKWATCNVGTTSPEGYGDYFAWGETEPYYSSQNPLTWKEGKSSGYVWASYFDANNGDTIFTKYTGEKATLDPEDDAAHVNWGGAWRMPTKAELEELKNTDNCTWKWNTNYNGTNVNGYLVTSKKNNNSIFLPASGFYLDASLYDVGSYGNYWSSSLHKSDSGGAYGLGFNSGSVGWYNNGRSNGQSVRPVCR